MSDKILAMIVWLRHFLGWVVGASLRTSLCVGNCWLSMPNVLAGDSLVRIGCSGSSCGSSGLDGKNRSSWSHPEPLSAGTVLGSGNIGNGFQGLGRGEDASL